MKHRAIDHAPVRLAGIICLAVLIAAASLITPTRALAQGGGTHTVQAGENLFRIALRYNMTVGDLAVANGIVDPTRIYAGQVLNIPVPGSVIAPAEPNYPPALPAEPYYPPALPAESAPVAPPPAAPAHSPPTGRLGHEPPRTGRGRPSHQPPRTRSSEQDRGLVPPVPRHRLELAGRLGQLDRHDVDAAQRDHGAPLLAVHGVDRVRPEPRGQDPVV